MIISTIIYLMKSGINFGIFLEAAELTHERPAANENVLLAAGKN